MDIQHRQLHANRTLHAQRALTAACAALLLSALPAAAQISVEVSPLRVELAAAAGSMTTQAITLINAGKEAVRVRATVTDWDLSKDGAPQFEGAVNGGPFSATGWVRVAPPEQVIEPGKEATVRFSLAVPAGVEPAGYRTGVLFEFAPGTGDPIAHAREVMFKSRIATLIYVDIGQAPMAAELTDLRSRTVGPRTQIVATVKNTSRRHVRTKGSVVLYDQAGRSVREVAIPDVPLLPESEREVAIAVIDPETQSAALPPGDYRVELKMDVGLPALLVGESTLKVQK